MTSFTTKRMRAASLSDIILTARPVSGRRIRCGMIMNDEWCVAAVRSTTNITSKDRDDGVMSVIYIYIYSSFLGINGGDDASTKLWWIAADRKWSGPVTACHDDWRAELVANLQVIR